MKGGSTGPLEVSTIRSDFDTLNRTVDGTQLVYFDNAATSLTPHVVVDAIVEYYTDYGVNVHRGAHRLSQETSEAYEMAHAHVGDFVGARENDCVVFTKNATESINLVATSFGSNRIGPGDEIILTEMEHHSSLVTWQQIAKQTGATLQYIGVDENGRLDMKQAEAVIGPDTQMVSVAHVSNVLGTVNPIDELADLAHANDAYIIVDGAQAVSHQPIDIDSIGADFYAFSGHKMCGPTGIGVLVGREDLLADMEPYQYGGTMIRSVSRQKSTWGSLPQKFEAGTPPIAQAIGLSVAVDYLESIGLKRIRRHEQQLTEYALEQLCDRDALSLLGPRDVDLRAGVISFEFDGITAYDLASILDDYSIAVRAGDHCARPLHNRLGVSESLRASFALYNTRIEVDTFVEALDDITQIFT